MYTIYTIYYIYYILYILYTIYTIYYIYYILYILYTIYIYGQIITTSLFSLTGIMVKKGNHPKMALVQVSELL